MCLRENCVLQEVVFFHRFLDLHLADAAVSKAFLHRVLVTLLAVLWLRHSQSLKEETLIGFPYTFIPWQ
jgi:hypothetical protein